MNQGVPASSSMRRHGPAAASAALAVLLAVPALAASPALTVTHPWIRFLTPQIPAAGYFTLHNNGAQPAVLTGAASQDCGQLMLHRSMEKSGMAEMAMVAAVTVPAHGSVTFQPGGYHLMCMSPAAAIAPGRHMPVTLKFKDGSSLPVDFPVYGAKGK
jgi:periplasmic copper chaperone A